MHNAEKDGDHKGCHYNGYSYTTYHCSGDPCGRHVPCVMCYLPCAMYHVLFAICHVPCTMCYLPYAMYHVPCAICHISCTVMYHMPCTMCYLPSPSLKSIYYSEYALCTHYFLLKRSE